MILAHPGQGEEDIHVCWRGAGLLMGGSEWGLRAQTVEIGLGNQAEMADWLHIKGLVK